MVPQSRLGDPRQAPSGRRLGARTVRSAHTYSTPVARSIKGFGTAPLQRRLELLISEHLLVAKVSINQYIKPEGLEQKGSGIVITRHGLWEADLAPWFASIATAALWAATSGGIVRV